MIGTLNKFSRTWVWKVLLVLITVPFLLLSVNTYLTPHEPANYAAKVGDQYVTGDQFQSAYQQQYNALLHRLGADKFREQFTPEIEKEFKLRVLNSLINELVLSEYANELGIQFTNDDIIKNIANNKDFFDSEGKFSNENYHNFLAQNGLKGSQYASILLNSMRLEFLENSLSGSVITVPKEITDAEKYSFPYANFQLYSKSSLDNVFKTSVTDEEVLSYYNNNIEQFVSPSTTKVKYVIFDSKKYQDSISISNVQVKQYYQDNIQRYTSASYDLSHIEVKDIDLANKIKAELDNGASFKELAKQYSIDSASNNIGGSLGTLSPNIFPADINKVLSSLKNGGYSNPVELDGTYHIFLMNRKIIDIKSLSTVSSDIKSYLKQLQIKSYFDEVSDRIKEDNDSGESNIKSIAELLNSKIITTDSFSRDKAPKDLKNDDLLDYIFGGILKGNQISNLIRLDENKYIVLSLLDYRAASPKPFEEVKEIAKVQAQRLKSEQEKFVDLKNIADKLNSLSSVEEENKILLDNKISFSEEKRYQRNTNVVYNFEPDLFSIQLLKGKSNYTVYKDSNFIYLVKLNSITSGSLSGDNVKLLNKYISEQNESSSLRLYLEELRKRYKVKIVEEVLNSSDS